MPDKQALRQQTGLAGSLAILTRLQPEVVTRGAAQAMRPTVSGRSSESKAGQALTTHLIH